jgi:hypothetical protein
MVGIAKDNRTHSGELNVTAGKGGDISLYNID